MSTNEELYKFPAPEGWVSKQVLDGFGYVAGPYYFRADPATPGVGFYAEERHTNLRGIIHGGALLTLADMSLFDICFRKIGRFKAVTVTLNSEFLGAGPVGEFIEATGEMTGGGKSLLFARGIVTAKGKPLLSFLGTLKRFE